MAKNSTLDEIIKQLQELQKNIPVMKKKTLDYFSTQVYEDINDIFDNAVYTYYRNYTPKYYKRQYTLYHMYDIKINKYILNWKIDSDLVPKGLHRVERGSSPNDDYIFYFMFELGYHGGANSIDDDKADIWGEHPDNGIPYYRTKHPSKAYRYGEIPYKNWAYQAEKDAISPLKNIEQQVNNYQNNKLNSTGHTLQSALNDAYDYVIDLFFN